MFLIPSPPLRANSLPPRPGGTLFTRHVDYPVKGQKGLRDSNIEMIDFC